MEKDHAGSIERIVEICKPEKIFCSVMGEKSMKAQFNTEGWPIQVVKDGERLNIGKRNITFLETRMLHWPDSMVSYLEEDKVLFSNDAFGQNVATSCRYVDEYDRHLLLQAMKDYYYNIILPYSPLVLKPMPKWQHSRINFVQLLPLKACGGLPKKWLMPLATASIVSVFPIPLLTHRKITVPW